MVVSNLYSYVFTSYVFLVVPHHSYAVVVKTKTPNVKQYALLQLHKHSTFSIWPAQVPPNAVPGSTLQCQAPDGRGLAYAVYWAHFWSQTWSVADIGMTSWGVVQVQIPQGVRPGQLCLRSKKPIPTLARNSLRMCNSQFLRESWFLSHHSSAWVKSAGKGTWKLDRHETMRHINGRVVVFGFCWVYHLEHINGGSPGSPLASGYSFKSSNLRSAQLVDLLRQRSVLAGDIFTDVQICSDDSSSMFWSLGRLGNLIKPKDRLVASLIDTNHQKHCH